MALSTGLMRRLRNDNSDEPLAKRLRLAENVLYSPDVPIVRKEDCIFSWLCSELSGQDANATWITIHRCLALEPKNFLKLDPETKNLLIENLVIRLNEYPESEVLEEMLKCCTYIFSNTNSQSFSKDNNIVSLMVALLTFTHKVLNSDESKETHVFKNSDVALENVENAVGAFAQLCKQNLSDKKEFATIFTEEILFPLALVVETVRTKKITSKIVLDTQKCIKKLCLGCIKSATLVADKDSEEIEEVNMFFKSLKSKVSTTETETTQAAFSCIYLCAVNTFQQNSVLLDFILRKLLECIEQKELFKKLLISFLESSIDVSYNYDGVVDGVTLREFLKTHMEQVIVKKKRFKHLDYQLLTVIAKLNPLLVEDVTQSILERILFENKKCSEEQIAHDDLIKELWRASVLLRKQQKYLSKFLLSVSSYEDKDIEEVDFRNNFELPIDFAKVFSEDLKTRTTSSQVIAMFHTLLFHMKSDCSNKFKTFGPTTQVCLMTKIVSRFFVIFFESSNFLDSSLPHDWQKKFYQAFTDLRNSLATFTENLTESVDKHDAVIFTAFIDMVKIWCEAYALLRYYAPNTVFKELDFPVDESQIKILKQMIKRHGNEDCQKSMYQLLLFKTTIFENADNSQLVMDKIISHLWPDILENHFQIIETFNVEQILKLTVYFINETSNSEDNLNKWTSILKRNIPRMTKTFATATALQIISNTVEDIKECKTKEYINKIDFGKVLTFMDDSETFRKILKSARKGIAKQDSKPLNTVNFGKIKRNLAFLSNLPLTFLDRNVRTLLFVALYTFEEETKQTTDLREYVTKIYSDLFRQNDVDVLSNVPKPLMLINHFKDNDVILMKIFKLSLNNLSSLQFWQEFATKKECNRKISSILLTCIGNSKNKVSSAECKNLLHELSAIFCDNIVKEVPAEIHDSDEISGLKIALKNILLQSKKLDDNLKSCVELTLKKATQDTETIVNNKLILEILQLSLIVLTHRENFNTDEDVIRKLCTILINSSDDKVFYHYLEVLKESEFAFFTKSLCNQTREASVNGSCQILEKLITIWEFVSKAEAKATRTKVLSTSVHNLFNDLLSSEIPESSSVFLIKLCKAFTTSKRMIRMTDRIVDSIFVISEQCLNHLSKDSKLITCQEALELCIDFLRARTDVLLDRLPALTNIFRKIAQIVLQEVKDVEFSDEQMFRILAIDIEKFCTFFAKLKKDVVRITPYLIADMIEMLLQAGVLPQFMKVSFESSISYLLPNCDRHAVSFLSRILPTASQQIFKIMYDNYVKYHKFTGKI